MYTEEGKWLVLSCRGCGAVHDHKDLKHKTFEKVFDELLAHMEGHSYKKHTLDVEDGCIIFTEDDHKVRIYFNESKVFKGFDSAGGNIGGGIGSAVTAQSVKSIKGQSFSISTNPYRMNFDAKLDQLENIIDKYMKVSSSYDDV